MVRSLRIERENGVYRVINRGNYRQDLFINEGAHRFLREMPLRGLREMWMGFGGHCVMTNHFHLVVRTPKGNLVYGMKWLQSTFANRYHRFRKVRVASVLKRKTSAPSTWIAERLNIGAPQLVSVYVNRLRRELAEQPNPDYDKFILKYTE